MLVFVNIVGNGEEKNNKDVKNGNLNVNFVKFVCLFVWVIG